MKEFKVLYDNNQIVTASKECMERMGFKKGKTTLRHTSAGEVKVTEYHTTHKTLSIKEGEYRKVFVYPNGHMVYNGMSTIHFTK